MFSTDRTRARLARLALRLAGVALLAGGLAPGAAHAAVSPAPAWDLTPMSAPTDFTAGSTYAASQDSYVITATNVGGASARTPSGGGSAITVSDTLPAGVTAATSGGTLLASGVDDPGNTITCAGSGHTVTCTDPQGTGAVLTDQQIQITIPVNVAAGTASGGVNQVTIAGGGAASVSATDATPIAAAAGFGVTDFSAQSLAADGTNDTQAGSTPNQVLTGLAFTSVLRSPGNVVPAGNLRTTALALPPGLVGNPTTVPECSQLDMDSTVNGGGVGDGCPSDTQVGVADVTIITAGGPSLVETPIYNLAPPSGTPAEFGFVVLSSVTHIDFSVRPGDYGLDATVSDTNAGAPLFQSTILLWGDPASSTHDDARFLTGNSYPGSTGAPGGAPIAATIPAASFVTNPTSCGAPPQTSVTVTDWQAPSSPISPDPVTSPATTGCAAVPFSPTASVQPSTSVANSPTGLDVNIAIPQSSDPTALAESNLQDVTVALPAGIAVSPSSANGLAACTQAEIGLGDSNPVSCPSASAIGTVQIQTPVLSTPLEGSVYLAQQTANPFGSLLAIYVTAQADGVLVKLAGEVTPNPTTGQLTATFDDNPQLPFSDLQVDFFGGPNAPLSTPGACGTYTSTTAMTPWSAPLSPRTSASSFTIGSDCMSGFAPTFSAGTTGGRAGHYSPFVLSLARSDTDQFLSGLQVKLPEGMLARITGVKECTDAELASISSRPGTGVAQEDHPSCPSGSRVGTVSAAAGPGTDPYNLAGHVYLTGPYNGGSFGLAVVVPAVAGPFDLGTVVVRQALDINPRTARVTVKSDPFPTMLDGIPLQLRAVSVDLNRHHFTIDPTSCGSMAVTGMLDSTAGATEAVRSPFHVGHCGALRFSPKLRMSLTGRHQTAVGTHPTLDATLTQPAGQANVRSERVTLPLSLALDPNNSEHVCSVADAARIACPRRTLVGEAIARTRILPVPLRGKVYLVQGEHKNKQGQILRTLPTLLIPLRGDHVAINLTAQTSVDSTEHLVTTFKAVPDAGIRSFTLTITGGKRGILVVTGHRSLCTRSQVGHVVAVGHNGKRSAAAVTMQTAACSAHQPSKPTRKKKQH